MFKSIETSFTLNGTIQRDCVQQFINPNDYERKTLKASFYRKDYVRKKKGHTINYVRFNGSKSCVKLYCFSIYKTLKSSTREYNRRKKNAPMSNNYVRGGRHDKISGHSVKA